MNTFAPNAVAVETRTVYRYTCVYRGAPGQEPSTASVLAYNAVMALHRIEDAIDGPSLLATDLISMVREDVPTPVIVTLDLPDYDGPGTLKRLALRMPYSDINDATEEAIKFFTVGDDFHPKFVDARIG